MKYVFLFLSLSVVLFSCLKLNDSSINQNISGNINNSDMLVSSKNSITNSNIILEHFADPSMFVYQKQHYITGTDELNTNHIPIYKYEYIGQKLSRDQFFLNYNPSKLDDAYFYCNIWAATISNIDGDIYLSFTGSGLKLFL